MPINLLAKEQLDYSGHSLIWLKHSATQETFHINTCVHFLSSSIHSWLIGNNAGAFGLHSKDAFSILVDKVCDLLLDCRSIPILAQDKCHIHSEQIHLLNLISEWKTPRSNFNMEFPSSTGIPVLRVYKSYQPYWELMRPCQNMSLDVDPTSWP